MKARKDERNLGILTKLSEAATAAASVGRTGFHIIHIILRFNTITAVGTKGVILRQFLVFIFFSVMAVTRSLN